MKKILVIGEACIDQFVYCNAVKLDPAIPVPVLNIVKTVSNGGMARNVYENIKNMDADVDILMNSGWEDSVKTRYVDNKSNHMFFRVDSNDSVEQIDLSKLDLDYEIVVVSDYNKGFLSEDDIRQICLSHNKVFIDTKKVLGPWINHAYIIKINDFEYRNSEKFINKNLSSKIIHTMGADGCEYNGKLYPVDKVEVKDVTGAGDTFMAALVVKYSETGSIEDGIKFANKCASEVVKHRGVNTL